LPTEPDEPEVESLLRMHAAGDLDPVPVILPPLPTPVTEPLLKVVELFKLVRGLRLAALDQREVLFSARWVAGKTGLPSATVWRVLKALEAAGTLVAGPSMPPLSGHKYGTASYAPGVLPGASVSVEGRAEVVGDADEPEAHLTDDARGLGGEGVADGEHGADGTWAVGSEGLYWTGRL